MDDERMRVLSPDESVAVLSLKHRVEFEHRVAESLFFSMEVGRMLGRPALPPTPFDRHRRCTANKCYAK